MVESRTSLPAQVGELVSAATTHAKTLLSRQRSVSDAMADIAAVNTLQQIDRVGAAYEGFYQDVLQEQQQYQQILFVYALVLLLLLAWLVYRPAAGRRGENGAKAKVTAPATVTVTPAGTATGARPARA